MSKRQFIMILGVWVAILPFLGFYSSWTAFLSVISGLAIVLIAYRINSPVKSVDSRANVPFVDHKSEPKKESGASEPVSPLPPTESK